MVTGNKQLSTTNNGVKVHAMAGLVNAGLIAMSGIYLYQKYDATTQQLNMPGMTLQLGDTAEHADHELKDDSDDD